VLAHRFVWCFLLMLVVLTVTRSWRRMRPVVGDRRTMLLLVAASALIAVNWGTFIWAVTNAQVVESSLGYLMTPLVTVLLATVVLRERLRPLQWLAVAIAAVAVTVLTIGHGAVPWVALLIATSWGGYSLCKKVVAVDPVASLTVETAIGTPFALAYLVFLGVTGALAFGHSTVGLTGMLVLSGAVTAVPLLLFAGAANNLPLSSLGLLQYLVPCLQLAIGVVLFHESMPVLRWVGFAIVWVALAVFTVDSARQRSAETLPDPEHATEPA